MAQWAKVSAMLPEDLSSNPRDQCWKGKTDSCKLLSDPHMELWCVVTHPTFTHKYVYALLIFKGSILGSEVMSQR